MGHDELKLLELNILAIHIFMHYSSVTYEKYHSYIHPYQYGQCCLYKYAGHEESKVTRLQTVERCQDRTTTDECSSQWRTSVEAHEGPKMNQNPGVPPDTW